MSWTRFVLNYNSTVCAWFSAARFLILLMFRFHNRVLKQLENINSSQLRHNHHLKCIFLNLRTLNLPKTSSGDFVKFYANYLFYCDIVIMFSWYCDHVLVILWSCSRDSVIMLIKSPLTWKVSWFFAWNIWYFVYCTFIFQGTSTRSDRNDVFVVLEQTCRLVLHTISLFWRLTSSTPWRKIC